MNHAVEDVRSHEMELTTRPRLVACLLGPRRRAFGRTPRDELLRLAPPDAGFCVVIQGWREQARPTQASPVAARLAESPYGQAFADSPEARKRLADLDEQLRTHLDVSWPQIRDEILGDAVLLAYTPGPPGQPEAEVGLLIVHVRRPDVLAPLLDRLTDRNRSLAKSTSVEGGSIAQQYPYLRPAPKGRSGRVLFLCGHDPGVHRQGGAAQVGHRPRLGRQPGADRPCRR